jgi:hypothetical protein
VKKKSLVEIALMEKIFFGFDQGKEETKRVLIK